MSTTTPSTSGLVTPGRSSGLLEVWRHRYLLMLIVRKELRVRYRGSMLGLAWSYVKPAIQFLVFYYAMGEFLKLKASLPPFAVYLFGGVVVMNLFGETFSNATRAIVLNASLVKKIFLPRELFPVAMLIVALVHFVPQLIVLIVAAIWTGWPMPGIAEIGSFVMGFLIVASFGLGLGMIFGAINVAFRDLENIVDLILMVATWMSPVLYSWPLVAQSLGHDSWLFKLYMANPLTVAVELFHRAFWYPQAVSSGLDDASYTIPDGLMVDGIIAVVACLATLVVGQIVFKRLQGRFAQEL